MTTEYGLNIVFYMKTYAQLKLDESYEFHLNNLGFKLSKIEGLDSAYSIIVKPIKDMKHAQDILNDVKLGLMMFTLDFNWVAFEIDEEIKTANMLSEAKYLDDDLLISGSFDINRTTLFPIVANLFQVTNHPIPFTNYLKIEKLKENIDSAFSIDSEKIISNEKLSLALEMYSRLSQFSRKTQFLDLITILEILKPKYEVSEESKQSLKLIKSQMKEIRKEFEKDSDEYNEFNRYFTEMGYWENKSINKSLQLFVNEHKEDFEEY
ncbi:hypothetical protein [uncultured Methanobrevibacter sp.]|uniref:hypothetical protein n=1 Tax=uncultured Methanobrevibacter sp. TaxID=253161 RepID=UPI00320AC1F4